MAKRPKAGWFRYLKEAFKYRWNLLLFGGAAAAAVLSGHADIALPLVAAGEVAYLAGLSTLPRFQAAIDAKAHHEKVPLPLGAAKTARGQVKKLGGMLAGLQHERRVRFQSLRKRCLEMRQLASNVRGQSGESSRADELRDPALNKLLWVFLRLLFSQQAMQKFLDATDEDAIKSNLAELVQRKKKAEEDDNERILRSVNDSIKTAMLRLENYRTAESNAEFVGVELDRIEGKIQAITEMAVSNQDPDYISSQVDAVAESMTHTEEAIHDLQSITGLTDEMEGPPDILEGSYMAEPDYESDLAVES